MSRAHCDVARRVAAHVGADGAVVDALDDVFERWDGTGNPAGTASNAITPAARVTVLAGDVGVLLRPRRRDRPCRRRRAVRAGLRPGAGRRRARGGASLAGRAGPQDAYDVLLEKAASWPDAGGVPVRQAMQVHRAAPLPLRLLHPDAHDRGRGGSGRRGSHHERLDGRGYHRQLSASAQPVASRLLAVADRVAAMTADRPHRPALTLDAIADTVRTEAAAGAVDALCVAAVLEVAGAPPAPVTWPADLTPCEVQALQLLARGLANRSAALRLRITEKTVSRHAESLYVKLRVNNRAALTYEALRRDLLHAPAEAG